MISVHLRISLTVQGVLSTENLLRRQPLWRRHNERTRATKCQTRPLLRFLLRRRRRRKEARREGVGWERKKSPTSAKKKDSVEKLPLGFIWRNHSALQFWIFLFFFSPSHSPFPFIHAPSLPTYLPPCPSLFSFALSLPVCLIRGL